MANRKSRNNKNKMNYFIKGALQGLVVSVVIVLVYLLSWYNTIVDYNWCYDLGRAGQEAAFKINHCEYYGTLKLTSHN